MTQHSPGPWKLVEDDAGHHREIADAEGNCVMAETSIGQETPTNHADWTLISTAAEMLELLKAVVATRHLHFITNDADRMRSWDDRVEAAIAKAEGR